VLAEAERLQQRRTRMWNSTAFVTPYQPVLDRGPAHRRSLALWSEAKFNFANFDLVPDLDWDALYASTLPKVRAATDTTAYTRRCARSSRNCTMDIGSIILPAAVADQLDAQPGIRTALVEDRVFVRELLDSGPGCHGHRTRDGDRRHRRPAGEGTGRRRTCAVTSQRPRRRTWRRARTNAPCSPGRSTARCAWAFATRAGRMRDVALTAHAVQGVR
jgi:hypothetical protein